MNSTPLEGVDMDDEYKWRIILAIGEFDLQ